jgi:hypothetical protein
MRPCKVYSSAPTYSSIPPRNNQNNPGVLVASMVSTWVPVEVATCNEVVCPGELPVGLSVLLSRGPRSLLAALAARCRASTYVHPSSPTQAPSNRSSVQWDRAALPVNSRGAQHAPVVRPPSTFSRNLPPGFGPPHVQLLGPKLLLYKMKGSAFQVSCACSARCRPPPRSSLRSPWHLTLRPRPT